MKSLKGYEMNNEEHAEHHQNALLFRDGEDSLTADPNTKAAVKIMFIHLTVVCSLIPLLPG